MTQSLLTYDEADILLREDGSRGHVGISGIDGLFTAVLAGAARLETDGRLPEIFADRMPIAETGTPAHQLVQTILHHHDEIAQTLARRSRQYQPIFMHHEGRVITKNGRWGSQALLLPTEQMMDQSRSRQSIEPLRYIRHPKQHRHAWLWPRPGQRILRIFSHESSHREK